MSTVRYELGRLAAVADTFDSGDVGYEARSARTERDKLICYAFARGATLSVLSEATGGMAIGTLSRITGGTPRGPVLDEQAPKPPVVPSEETPDA